MNGNFSDKEIEGGNREQKEKPKQVVWIIDDSSAIQETVGEFLKMEGFEIRTFSSGESALEALGKENPPFAFIIDGNLGSDRMKGWQITQALGERGVNAFIVAHSSDNRDNSRIEEEAKKFGIRVKSFEKGGYQYSFDEMAEAIRSLKD